MCARRSHPLSKRRPSSGHSPLQKGGQQQERWGGGSVGARIGERCMSDSHRTGERCMSDSHRTGERCASDSYGRGGERGRRTGSLRRFMQVEAVGRRASASSGGWLVFWMQNAGWSSRKPTCTPPQRLPPPPPLPPVLTGRGSRRLAVCGGRLAPQGGSQGSPPPSPTLPPTTRPTVLSFSPSTPRPSPTVSGRVAGVRRWIAREDRAAAGASRR